jgi:hypothetical protein
MTEARMNSPLMQVNRGSNLIQAHNKNVWRFSQLLKMRQRLSNELLALRGLAMEVHSVRAPSDEANAGLSKGERKTLSVCPKS